ncbi:hypothetical protein DL764_001483 [Monosporascus ibericus]|uniref:Uncharacterized protein n=1 Tax=Monosporascus ibericus TaxID=155417 RepID=A0A4Q4TPA7_9PEZI|nr:hypothetical protein DL764_001483 [Monosporascus ibericus]
MAPGILEPSFGRLVIDEKRSDGYWVETFHFSNQESVPGIIASGLVSGNVEFLDNPLATQEGADPASEWKKYVIAKFDSPVGVVACDVTGNGLTDVVVCHDYGPFMLECNMAGGWITWLENPGRDKLDAGPWKERKIGRWPAMHRIKAGHFTQRNEWPREIVDDEHFTVIHEVTVKKLDGPDGIDSMLISSREGTTLLYYDHGNWKRDLIGIGEPKEPRQSPTSESPGSGDHWGTGCADSGCVGGDPLAYIATLDPFHGTAACVYTPTKQGPRGTEWKRHVLDPQPGPGPNKGMMYYKAIDLEKGLFAKWKISEESSARIAIGNFGGNGKLDMVSVRYNVARYYEEPQPIITLHLNQFAESSTTDDAAAIVPTFWDNEGLVYLARPTEVRSAQRLPLMEIANFALSIEIHPKGGKVDVEPGHGIKVLYGSVSDGQDVRSALGVASFPEIVPVTSNNTMLTANEENGAILLRLVPIAEAATWKTAQEVPVRTTFDTSNIGVNFPELQFRKVEELWWGADFKGVDFYNLSGFSFRFQDEKTHIAHIQFWTAGTNVDCGMHNHSGNMFQEVHVCLSLGTRDGGMSRLEGDEYDPNATNCFEHISTPPLYEHGGMWYRDSNGNPIRGKNNVVAYPWHKWQGGSGPDVDVWMAIEFNPNIKL